MDQNHRKSNVFLFILIFDAFGAGLELLQQAYYIHSDQKSQIAVKKELNKEKNLNLTPPIRIRE